KLVTRIVCFNEVRCRGERGHCEPTESSAYGERCRLLTYKRPPVRIYERTPKNDPHRPAPRGTTCIMMMNTIILFTTRFCFWRAKGSLTTKKQANFSNLAILRLGMQECNNSDFFGIYGCFASGSPKEPKNEQQDAGHSQSNLFDPGDCARVSRN